MTIFLNGESIHLQKASTLEEVIEKKGYLKSRIALEINGQITPFSLCKGRILCPGDRIEVVAFVGGG